VPNPGPDAISTFGWVTRSRARGARVVLAGPVIFYFVVRYRSEIHDATIGKLTGERLASQPPTVPVPGQDTGSFRWVNWISISCILVLAALTAWLFVSPARRWVFDRAILLPVVLGAWVPVIGWLARVSYRARLPIVFFVLVGTALITTWWGAGHEIRLMPETTVAGKSTPRAGTQWYLDTAVAQWASANDCELTILQPEERVEYSESGVVKVEKPLETDDKPCPSPVIVAAAGGASRAAFITAATLGTLLDATCSKRPDGALGCDGRPIFANRLFANENALSSTPVPGETVSVSVSVSQVSVSQSGEKPKTPGAWVVNRVGAS
jgi:hypothetical protein